ncbi:MAG: alpha-amylase family glycosyl hydrolase [Pseudomonadota bacterium]
MSQPEQHQHALPPHKCAEGIRFTFDGAPGVRSVAVAGTFNSWVGDDCPLHRTGAGRWQTTLPIATGRQLYKYVIDGQHWILDPANAWISEDGQNNSSFTVDEDGDVFIRSGNANAQHPGPLYGRHQALRSPAWLADGVIYQLSVRAFGGNFAGVQARLDHLAALGVSVIWMMPIHPIGRAGRLGTLGDPYAVRDFCAIDAALGDAAALRALVAAIHARGMRLLMDWTLNRASVDNTLVARHPDWFTRKADGTLLLCGPEPRLLRRPRFYKASLARAPDRRAAAMGGGLRYRRLPL